MDLDSVLGDIFLPGLVKQVFNKYKRSGKSLTTGERLNLFSELSALLGEDLLERALFLLDEWSFITYQTSDGLRRIVELANKRNSAHVFRVVPGINYCKCRYFQRCVLRLTASAEEEADHELEDTYSKVSFTCEHLLAQRLHQLFTAEPRIQILKLENFRYFHNDIYVD